MKVLITGGLGVNGAVTARLMVKDGLRPVLMDNRMDLTLMGDIKDQVDFVLGDICDQAALEKVDEKGDQNDDEHGQRPGFQAGVFRGRRGPRGE